MANRPADDPILLSICDTLGRWMRRVRRRPFILGLCGAQGSGKSTLAHALAGRFAAAGTSTAILSLDDLYKKKADRIAMAAEIHPLFRTRGVPGTHDVALGLDAIRALRAGIAAALPRFDKGTDDRIAAADWPTAPADTEVLILEGWFVGARPEPEPALDLPINALERREDGDGRWRRAVNAHLEDHRPLFAEIDILVFLAAPSFEIVRHWRAEQEAELRARSGAGMSDAEIDRFIAHYERLTRHLLRTMPHYADLTYRLAEDRSLSSA